MPKKPWNITDEAVYSLVTKNAEKLNMNICTYVSAISMKPKLYAIAVYNNTKTLELLSHSEMCVLQLLNESQIHLVKHLGFKTGKLYDKMNFLRKKNEVTHWNDFEVLKNCAALLLLRKTNEINVHGDHQLFIFEVIKHQLLDKNYLSLNHLRAKKLIRI